MATSRYVLPATGITSIPKEPPFPWAAVVQRGDIFKSAWPEHEVNCENKRIGVIGTGSSGIQERQLILSQRRSILDEQKREEIKKNFGANWDIVKVNLAGHAVKHSGRIVSGVRDPEEIRHVFQDANTATANFIRDKIRSMAREPESAEALCLTYPFGARRPPCANGYYEMSNRTNVKLVDISKGEIEVYENGFRAASGAEYELDMIIPDTGIRYGHRRNEYDSRRREREQASTRALDAEARSTCWRLGNQPVSLEAFASWIGKTIEHMKCSGIDVDNEAMDAWTTNVEQVWTSSLLAKHAHEQRSCYVGTNVPGKSSRIMFYFGGIVNLEPWLNREL